MKTLDEVRTGTPIHAADLPLTITTPGVYYLAQDIDRAAASGGIKIHASDVTLDLNGHRLSNGTGNGIEVSGTGATPPALRVRIRNGTVAGWTGDGVVGSFSSNAVVEDVIAEGNGGYGIALGGDFNEVRRCATRGNGDGGINVYGNSRVVDSTADDNGDHPGAPGINTPDNGTIERCRAKGNTGSGIEVGDGSTVKDSTAIGNTGTGIATLGGIGGLRGCTVERSTASSNGQGGFSGSFTTFTDLTSTDNTGAGVNAGSSSKVMGCRVTGNTGTGIGATTNSQIRINHIESNGGGGIQAGTHNAVEDNTCQSNPMFGIRTTGGFNVIKGNTVKGSIGQGIHVPAPGKNTVIRNVAGANTGGNYSVVGGNDLGPVTKASTSTNPNSNIDQDLP